MTNCGRMSQAGGWNRNAKIVGYTALSGKPQSKNAGQRTGANVRSLPSGRAASEEFAAVPPALTVGDAALAWIEEGKRRNLERSTMDKRRGHFEFHIRPFLGAERLCDLTPPCIDQYLSRLRDHPCANDASKNISPAMVKKVLASLKALLRHAERMGHIDRNPAAPISFATSTRGRRKIRAGRDFPSKDEVRRILSCASGRWRPLFVTAALTGMRSSELRGLTWDDVDFERKVIRVHQRADAWGVIGSPKSEAGERDIPMMPSVSQALREWRLICPRRAGGEGALGELWFVFPNGKGNTESHSNIVNRGFLPIQRDIGIADSASCDRSGAAVAKPRYGLHALRHFFSTYMIDCGIAPKRLQAMLGHSSFSMTMDTYGHLFEDPERDQALMIAADGQLFVR